MATKNNAIDGGTVLIIGGVVVLAIILLAIDAVADGVKNLLAQGGLPPAVAGEVGAIVFGGIVIVLIALGLRHSRVL